MVATQDLRRDGDLGGEVEGTGDEEAGIGEESVVEAEVVAMGADDVTDGKVVVDGGVASCHGKDKTQRPDGVGKGKRELTKLALGVARMNGMGRRESGRSVTTCATAGLCW